MDRYESMMVVGFLALVITLEVFLFSGAANGSPTPTPTSTPTPFVATPTPSAIVATPQGLIMTESGDYIGQFGFKATRPWKLLEEQDCQGARDSGSYIQFGSSWPQSISNVGGRWFYGYPGTITVTIQNACYMHVEVWNR